MHSSELDDFKTEISRNGFIINDFKLNGVDLTNWQSHQIIEIQGSVTVKRISTQKQKSYSTGHGTSWVADFAKDLKSGFFE